MFEFTENEEVADTAHLTNIITEYRKHGFTTALDDCGAGYAGLVLLIDFQPEMIKIDVQLVREIDSSPARQASWLESSASPKTWASRCSQKSSRPRPSSWF